MSLTSELHDGPLKTLFAEAFDTRRVCGQVTERCGGLAKSIHVGLTGTDLAWIGIGIDYRIRFYFHRLCIADLISWRAVFQDRNEALVASFSQVFLENSIALFSELSGFLTRTDPHRRRLDSREERTFCCYCLVLARLDQLYRAFGPTIKRMDEDRLFDKPNPLVVLNSDFFEPKALIVALFRTIPKPVIDDMVDLSYLFYEQRRRWFKAKTVVANPEFPHSKTVGGADGDLVIDDTYYDIKSSARITARDFFQIFSYPLLDHADQFQYPKGERQQWAQGGFGIRRIGFYLARYGLEISWSRKELFRLMARPGWDYATFEYRFRTVLRAIGKRWGRLRKNAKNSYPVCAEIDGDRKMFRDSVGEEDEKKKERA